MAMHGTVIDILDNMSECKVVIVGDKGVGKTALVRKFTSGHFEEMLPVLMHVQNQKIHYVGQRRTKFVISEFNELDDIKVKCNIQDNKSDHKGYQLKCNPLISADVFLLCFSITSRSSLINAVTTWVPNLMKTFPSTPIVLVGCKSDMRSVHSKAHFNISSEQALAMSKQSGAVMYVETSAKLSGRSTASAFEVAALACLGHFSRQSSVISSSSLISNSTRPRSKSAKRRDSSEPRSRGSKLNCLITCDPYQPHPLTLGSKTGSLSSVSLQSKSSTLSSNKSDSSVISISTNKTPLVSRKEGKKVKSEEMIIIKCQRLNSHKEVEEVEIEVPANVYNKIHDNSDVNCNLVRDSKDRKSFGSRLKRLILRD